MKQRLVAIQALAADAVANSRDATGLVQQIKGLPEKNGGKGGGGAANKAALVQAHADSLKMVWAVTYELSGVVLVGGIFVGTMSLNHAHHTEHRLVGQDGTEETEDVDLDRIDMEGRRATWSS
jgi:hypothetical protein